MVIELQTALWPAPITIDTSKRTEGASGAVLAVVKPQIRVLTSQDGAALVSWAPAGPPDSNPLATLLAVAAVTTVLAFAIYGVSKAL
jgi:hypothetical protein